MSSTSTTPRNSTSSFRSSIASMKSMAKEHHQSVQGAYEAYYGPAAVKRASVVSTKSASPSASSEQKKQNRLSSSWAGFKELAREHHRAVNSAYTSYYGAGAHRIPQARAPPARV